MEAMNLVSLLQSHNSMLPVSDEDYESALNNRAPATDEHGNLVMRAGIDCPKCKNHEYIWVVRDGERMTRECECKAMRNNIARIESSGLKEQMQRCTFESFETPNAWQQTAKDMVMRFVRDKDRGWLVLSGQPGCGKTHLSTAAAGKFLRAGAETRYMRWVDDGTMLKALITDDEAYRKRITKLKVCKVLYIDDFWKTQRGKEPSPADVKLAFEILDYRYCNRGLVTIISTERSIDELLEIDPAVGSRIYEMSRGYRLDFGPSADKNWRLKT